MAQDGDTINYTFSNNLDSNNRLIPEKEDISAVDEAVVNFCDGASSPTAATGNVAASGGRVENATIDVTNQSTLFIWVAGEGSNGIRTGKGRYQGGNNNSVTDEGGGSTEISFSNTDQTDSSDEPFLVGAGGAQGTSDTVVPSGGAREGQGDPSFDPDDNGEGIAPPLGGSGGSRSGPAEDGDGAIDDLNRGLVSGGTIIKGGGSSSTNDGEIEIFYQTAGPSKPTAPSGLTLTEQ
jgi:hypothetical protein